MEVHIPEEIIEDIISRLEVESVLKFRCVSKSWRLLIDSGRFIKRHLEHSRRKREFPHQSFIISSSSSTSTSTVWQVPVQFSDDPPPIPMHFPCNGEACVVGCCNGLVCIMEEQRDFLMWNPSTRAVRKLPRLEHPHDLWDVERPVLGWDGSCEAYYVFAFLHDYTSGSTQGGIYSSSTNSWKMIEHPLLDLSHGEGQFVGGRFHWQIEQRRGRHEIVSFDPESGSFGKVGGPPLALGYVTLVVVGEWLGMVENGNDDCEKIELEKDIGTEIGVWMMKELGARESWVRLVSVEQLHPQRETVVDEDGEVSVLYGSSFLVGWYKDSRFRFPPVAKFEAGVLHLHLQTLVSPFSTL